VPLKIFNKHMQSDEDHRVWFLLAQRFHKSRYLYRRADVPTPREQAAAQHVLDGLYAHVSPNPFADIDTIVEWPSQRSCMSASAAGTIARPTLSTIAVPRSPVVGL
jgi:hypothetical protein